MTSMRKRNFENSNSLSLSCYYSIPMKRRNSEKMSWMSCCWTGCYLMRSWTAMNSKSYCFQTSWMTKHWMMKMMIQKTNCYLTNCCWTQTNWSLKTIRWMMSCYYSLRKKSYYWTQMSWMSCCSGLTMRSLSFQNSNCCCWTQTMMRKMTIRYCLKNYCSMKNCFPMSLTMMRTHCCWTNFQMKSLRKKSCFQRSCYWMMTSWKRMRNWSIHQPQHPG